MPMTFSAVDTDTTEHMVVWATSVIHCAKLCLTRQRYNIFAFSKYSKSCTCFGNETVVTELERKADTKYFMKKEQPSEVEEHKSRSDRTESPRFNEIELYRLKTESFEGCGKECLTRSFCKSLMYDSSDGLCILNLATRACLVNDTLTKNSKYFERADIPASLVNQCQHKDCHIDEKCDESETTDGVCVQEGFSTKSFARFTRGPTDISCSPETDDVRLLRLECREFDHVDATPHCPVLRVTRQMDMCNLTIGLSCTPEDCMIPGKAYTGKRTCTLSGRTCQHWKDNEPHSHRFHDGDMFPEGDEREAKNYCRRPNSVTMPWCYTTDPEVKWEPCDVATCPWYEQTYCGYPSYHDRQIIGSDDNICVREGRMCDRNGRYIGHQNCADNGQQCQHWVSNVPTHHEYHESFYFPDTDEMAAKNYCRAPDGDHAAWCYTEYKPRGEYCVVPSCLP
ncbi:hypothetical protein ScPMuIL_001158 [Solemya velum]